MSIKVAVNGLGRIGRLVIRVLAERSDDNVELVAINGTRSPEDHAHLIKYDSIHGVFEGEITVKRRNEESFLELKANKQNKKLTVRFSQEREIEKLDWSGIDIVLECSGKFNSKEKSEQHLKQGAKKVIVSAPCKNADKVIVFGVNNEILTIEDQVISIGSCTTNALAPIAKILNDNLGIEKGFMTTVHAYTNDQNILDANHKDLRRARAAATSIIPTSTGAAKAIAEVLPELKGKLDGAAARVPIPNVSMVDLTFLSAKQTTKDDINKLIIDNAKNNYGQVLSIAEAQLVSTDFNHNKYSSVFDPYETYVTMGNFCRVVTWYDNEWGFSHRMVDMAKYFGELLND